MPGMTKASRASLKLARLLESREDYSYTGSGEWAKQSLKGFAVGAAEVSAVSEHQHEPLQLT